MSPLPFTVVVPVKTLSRAKSRLGALPDGVRRELALAFALDVVGAAVAAARVGEVRVVTDEPDVAAAVRRLGASVVPDAGVGDLNAAAGSAVAQAAAGPVAVLLGDLPCLDAASLDEALAAASAAGSGFVPDRAGTGTTLLAFVRPEAFASRFGAGSRDAHLALGVSELGQAPPSVRLDVDTPEDLEAAVVLGVGAHTHAALERLQHRSA